MSAAPHKWEFRARFRRNAFGWKSQPAITRIKEAVSEIRKVAKKDPVLGAEGAVLLLERLSPALERIDSSSGAIGNAVERAIDALVPIIAQADVEADVRQKWLERLWQAIQDDQMPYIESLGDRFGELCVHPHLASRWADELLSLALRVLAPDANPGVWFQGTTACLSALLVAGRYEEILTIVGRSRLRGMLHYRVFAVRALAKMERFEDALIELESDADVNDSAYHIAEVGEEILLAAGETNRAFLNYAFQANRKSTFLATYRALCKKYPEIEARKILLYCIESTPGEEGKWFAAARHAGFLDVALQLATDGRTEPRTLVNAARDHAASDPDFAVRVGIAALQGLDLGYGYNEASPVDVLTAYDAVLLAAKAAGSADAIAAALRDQFVQQRGFVWMVLNRNRPGWDPSGEKAPKISKQSPSKGKDPKKNREDALARAQGIMYDAWDARTPQQAIALAKKALTISADCADAYNLLADYSARTWEEAVDLYSKGVEAGRRAIGEQAFAETKGYFWGVLETRPYMRARAGLARLFQAVGILDEAIIHFEEMLLLNPNDNQGIRYLLMSSLIEGGYDSDAEMLFKEYGDEPTAAWMYARALLDFRQHGDGVAAKTSLKAALKQNSFVPDFLLGRKKLPPTPPTHYGFGDESEAILYAFENAEGWQSTAGALEWFAAAVK